MASIDDSRTGMRKQSGIADLIVKGAIALVTAAFFIGAYLQFQVTFWLALIVALSVYITLLMLHALMRRSERVDALVTEVSRLEDELSRLKGPGAGAYAPPARGPQLRGVAAARPSARSPLAAAGARPDVRASAPPPERGPQPPEAPAAPYAPPAAAAGAPHPEAPPALSPWPGTPASGDSLHDYWSFRPAKPALPEASQARRNETVAVPAERETDLEAVQGMIERLANELSLGGDAAKESGYSNPEHMVRASADALHATADTMRAAATKAPPAASRRDREPVPPMPPPIAPAHSRLSSVAAAIAAGRMDILLEPIVGLADHQVHHHEVTVRPRDEGGIILPLAVADRQLARTGLLPLLDSARLKRAAQICRSFAEEGRKGCVFSAASAESLATDRFLDEIANAFRRREALVRELVLTFTLSDIRAFGGTEWSALTDMRDLGFRFGLEDVRDVDYEFTALRAAGFAFVKLDAASFLAGLPGPAGMVPAGELCRRLGEIGLAVIVGHIDDEATRASVLECGVPLGQGRLFGPPLTVSPEGVPGSGIAAA
jgi:cyclic-di-GMP phosphodiesterase TipF (flagellum assembly factor)